MKPGPCAPLHLRTRLELAFLPIRSGELSDASSKTHAVLKQALEAVAYQPGFSAHYFGSQVKNPNILQLVTSKHPFCDALHAICAALPRGQDFVMALLMFFF
jgi:hypothetical protein